MSGQLELTQVEFALLGGEPVFASQVPAGQLHLPTGERYEAALRGIGKRQCYTDHGPLAVEAESRLADFLGVRNVVCVSTATAGLMMAAKALGLSGAVVMPAFASPATAEALACAGVKPRFCDVDDGGFHATAATVEAVLDDDVQAILGVNLWGEVCDVAGLAELAAQRRIILYFDSAHAFGCAVAGRAVGTFGALEVFSFHASNVIGAGGGACISTDEDELAARLRKIRSSYGADCSVPASITSNSCFSEAQAALTLTALDDFDANLDCNRDQLDVYAAGTAAIPGLSLVTPARAERSNHQTAVLEVDAETFGLSAAQLVKVLRAERIDAEQPCRRGLHQTSPFRAGFSGSLPNVERACTATVQLPLGSALELSDVAAIVLLLDAVHRGADRLAAAL